jgi:MoaA/NifB/PqqE/SkfB family radical SAM enzyme
MIKSLLKKIMPLKAVLFLRDAKNLYLVHNRKFKVLALTMELSSLCSLRCQLCSVPYIKRKKGNMSFDDFKTIVDKLPSTIKYVRFNFAGEPLMNPNAFKMINYIHQKLPRITSLVSTNGEFLDSFPVKEILESGLTHLCVCIDGADAETHSSYRVNANFDRVLKATERLSRAKEKNGNRGPVIIQQTLLNNLNFHQVEDIEKLARNLGVDELHLRWMGVPGMGKSRDELLKAMPGFSDKPESYFSDMAKKYLPPDQASLYASPGARRVKGELMRCTSYEMPFILQNGDVAVCCHDPEGQTVFGNLVKESFEDIFRKIPAEAIFNKKFPICAVCDLTECGKNVKEIKLK